MTSSLRRLTLTILAEARLENEAGVTIPMSYVEDLARLAGFRDLEEAKAALVTETEAMRTARTVTPRPVKGRAGA